MWNVSIDNLLDTATGMHRRCVEVIPLNVDVLASTAADAALDLHADDDAVAA